MSQLAEAKRDLPQTVRDFLLREWDPIGIHDIPEAQDEYDAYVPTLCAMLVARKSSYELFKYLLRMETEHMGLTADDRHTQRIAEYLANLNGSH